MKLILVALLLWSASAYADKSHCGPNGFSPQAPEWVCNAPEGGQVPEPGSLALVLIGLAAARIVKRKRA